jgi:hypothetical protein
MKRTNSDSVGSQETVPPGFSVEPCGRGAFIVYHARTGMGCMNVFLIVWLAGWTVGCIFLLHQYFGGGVMEDGNPIPLWFVLVFWAAEIAVAGLLIFLLFCKKSFRIDQDTLIMETAVLGFKRRKTILRDSIHQLAQVKNGGKHEDSFPSWGLRVEGVKKTTLIRWQSHEKSRWLGQVLAQWAGVKFAEVPED